MFLLFIIQLINDCKPRIDRIFCFAFLLVESFPIKYYVPTSKSSVRSSLRACVCFHWNALLSQGQTLQIIASKRATKPLEKHWSAEDWSLTAARDWVWLEVDERTNGAEWLFEGSTSTAASDAVVGGKARQSKGSTELWKSTSVWITTSSRDGG